MSGIFHPGWVYHHRPVADSGLLARVLIEREISAGVFDVLTGEIAGAQIDPVYLGSAQIQNIAFPTTRDFIEDSAKFQRMQVVVGFSTNELPELVYNVRVNDRVTVLANPADPEKVGTIMYVHGDASSSNAWQRVLTCQTNMKQDNG